MIDVDANMFRAAAECRSTEETRYYLNGVYVTPHPVKGVVLTATDGHRLISLHDEAGKCSAPKIINIDAKAIDVTAYNALRKAMPGETPRIVVGEDGIVTVGTYRSLKSCFIDGTYPDWPLVVRPLLAKAKEGKHAPASYNQKYVASFGKIAMMLSPGDSRGCSIRIISFSEMDASLIRFGGIDYAFGVLMPMHGSSSNEIPIWMKPILEPAPPTPAEPASPEPAQPEPKVASNAKRPVARRLVKKSKPSRTVKKTKKRRAA